MGLTFIDMFAGIGGFRTGLEKAGHRCVGFIEWDKFARQSYQAMYDTQGEFSANDIQQAKGTELPTADIWTFGSPCTDISLAGKRKGLIKGKQSSMFFEVIRLLEERINGKKTIPTYLIMENVKALLSSNGGRDFARVILEMGKVGYDVEWAVLNSSDVVPQNRERVYIVGHLRTTSTRKIFPIQRKSSKASKTSKIKSLGFLEDKHHQSNNVISSEGLARTLTAVDFKRPQKVAVKQLGNISESKSFGGNPQTGRVYSQDGLSPTLNTMQGGGREPKVAVRVCLTPNRINKRQNGRRFKENNEPEFTLTAEDRHGVLLDDGNTLTIRKLTPLECWRLQGFSDEQFYKAKNAGVSDSQLYKQAGNAVTAKVIEEIGKKLGDLESDKTN